MHTPWINALTRKTNSMLLQQPGQVFGAMSREFESTLIRCALAATGGCRIDAARLLGIGRNTITRKIHALGLDSLNASSPDAAGARVNSTAPAELAKTQETVKPVVAKFTPQIGEDFVKEFYAEIEAARRME